MTSAVQHLAWARRAIESGRYLLQGGFFEGAGRGGYMAAFHAALAYIVHMTGKEPKTHRGTHTEFARVARETGRISAGDVSFLSHSYELKEIADYDGDRPVSAAEAEAALTTAAALIEVIEGLLSSGSKPSDP